MISIRFQLYFENSNTPLVSVFRGNILAILQVFDFTLGPRILMQNRYLVWNVLCRNVASRYRGSALGFVWSFMYPLMMLSVYTFVFSVVFKARWGAEAFSGNSASFPLLMFCGMAVFNIFSESVNFSVGLVVSNPGFVKKVIFPLEVLPFCSVLTSLFFGLAWFALLLIGMLFFLGTVPWTILLLPLTLAPILLISLGVSLFVASLGVYLRDIQQVVGIVTQVLFFMTPIFYPASVVPERYRWVLELNPLSTVVDQTRNLFLFGRLPDFWPMITVYIVAVLTFQLGLVWFTNTKKGFADVL